MSEKNLWRTRIELKFMYYDIIRVQNQCSEIALVHVEGNTVNFLQKLFKKECMGHNKRNLIKTSVNLSLHRRLTLRAIHFHNVVTTH
jgi:hypothetical protein